MGDFHANRFFLPVMGKALLKKDGPLGFGDERTARGKIDISRAVVRFDTFPNEGGIAGHGKFSLPRGKRAVNGTRVPKYLRKYKKSLTFTAN